MGNTFAFENIIHIIQIICLKYFKYLCVLYIIEWIIFYLIFDKAFKMKQIIHYLNLNNFKIKKIIKVEAKKNRDYLIKLFQFSKHLR